MENIPFEPESIEQLQARYAAAVAEVISEARVRQCPAESPSYNRRHVFDHAGEESWRCIVAVMDYQPRHDGLAGPMLAVFVRWADVTPVVPMAVARASRIFSLLSGNTGELPILGFSMVQGFFCLFLAAQAAAPAREVQA